MEKFVFTRFEPSGMVDHPNIRSTTSIVDFIFRALAYEYLGRTDLVHVLATLDASKLDLKAPLVHRQDRDFIAAYTKTYGKGRVFYSTLGHPRELWDEPWMQTMYFEALKWAMRVP